MMSTHTGYVLRLIFDTVLVNCQLRHALHALFHIFTHILLVFWTYFSDIAHTVYHFFFRFCSIVRSLILHICYIHLSEHIFSSNFENTLFSSKKGNRKPWQLNDCVFIDYLLYFFHSRKRSITKSLDQESLKHKTRKLTIKKKTIKTMNTLKWNRKANKSIHAGKLTKVKHSAHMIDETISRCQLPFKCVNFISIHTFRISNRK